MDIFQINGTRCNGDWNETTTFTATSQVLLQEINERFEDMVLENLDAINANVKAGIFTRNFGACAMQFGQKCEFFDLCHNNSMNDLEVKPE